LGINDGTSNVAYFILRPNCHKEATLMTDLTLGQGLSLSIAFLDQKGNPMATPVVADAPPAWTNDATIETLTVAADGMTADTVSIAVGADKINLAMKVGGADFSASLDVTVADVPQVLTSIQIVATEK
jgi:hypothetical protein